MMNVIPAKYLLYNIYIEHPVPVAYHVVMILDQLHVINSVAIVKMLSASIPLLNAGRVVCGL